MLEFENWESEAPSEVHTINRDAPRAEPRTPEARYLRTWRRLPSCDLHFKIIARQPMKTELQRNVGSKDQYCRLRFQRSCWTLLLVTRTLSYPRVASANRGTNSNWISHLIHTMIPNQR